MIGALTRRRAEISDVVTARVDDPSVAALLDRQDQPGRRARHRPARSPTTAGCRGSTPTCPPTSARCSATWSTTPSTPRPAPAAARVDVRLALDGDAVLVQVADTGPGVPPRTPRSSSAATRTKPGDASGRGVGLALVQVVCERRGGSVSVHNADGAVFTARLPRDRGPS